MQAARHEEQEKTPITASTSRDGLRSLSRTGPLIIPRRLFGIRLMSVGHTTCSLLILGSPLYPTGFPFLLLLATAKLGLRLGCRFCLRFLKPDGSRQSSSGSISSSRPGPECLSSEPGRDVPVMRLVGRDDRTFER